MIQGPKDLCFPCVLCLICFPGEDFPSQSRVAASAWTLAVTIHLLSLPSLLPEGCCERAVSVYSGANLVKRWTI